MGVENRNDQASRQRRPEPRSWERTTGWQRQTRGSWTPRQTSSVVRAGLQEKYEAELVAVCKAYPGTKIWRQEEGLWLLVESSLLTGLQQSATFLIGISYAYAAVRSWGFWRAGLVDAIWIGPRHTNFTDGSICAFEPGDKTWFFDSPIVELLDFYTVWALRHLHLKIFGRWPGPQVVHHPYERILELRADEYCGCGVSGKLYGECCQTEDLARNQITDAIDFLRCTSGGIRKPPASIVSFVHEQRETPKLSDFVN
jgi:hypothetical protein